MLKKKKNKQSRSQSSTEKNPKKTLQPSSDSSPSPRLLSIFRSKLANGKDLKHMFRGLRSKATPGLSSQSRIVRCPKCQKLLQEPIDATFYKCSGCDSILQAKGWELESNDKSIQEALLSSQNRSLSTEVESAYGGSKTPMRSPHRDYNSRASPSVESSYHSETVYKHETSNIHREWMRRAGEFSVPHDSDVFVSARSSPYNPRSNGSEWTQHEGRYIEPPRVPFYPASPSPSYGYSSPYHGSQVSASEQSYYHHQTNQFPQYGREGWFQESSVASPMTSDGKYYHWSSQSQLNDLQYHNLYESSSSATPHRSVYSERSYQAATLPLRSNYSEHSMGISMSETSSEKSSHRDRKKHVRERNPVVKRYVLPSAGGAPFATCSYCLELLQLPQVSLHGKHKRYQVRCGSCSGVLKFSIREKVETVLDSPNFVDSRSDFADETVPIHQDSAAESHEEIYPDDSHRSGSDNRSGDRIRRSTNSVMSRRNLETFEALQYQWKPTLNPKLSEQQPPSSEIIGETSRIHLDLCEETHSEKSTKKDHTIFERVRSNLESGYKKNEILKPEEMFGDGSGESLVLPVYKSKMMSESSEEAERVAERQKSQNTRDSHEIDWEETQENGEYGGETIWGEIMEDNTELHLEKPRYIGDSVCDGSSNYGETLEDTAVKEDTEHISNIFSDVLSATPQSPVKALLNDNQRFIGHPGQSGEATVTISKIHEQYEYENTSETQDLDNTINDRLGYELEESRYERYETLAPGKVSEDGYNVSLKKVSETFITNIEGETGEERLVSHQMDSPKEKVENSYDRLEPVYLEGSGYAGERTWAETGEDRAGLHLEEYEINYENYRNPFEWTSEGAATFHLNEYEPETILEPEEDIQGRSESSSRGSFNDHESSEDSDVVHKSQEAKPYQSQYENSSEIQELSNTVYESFEPGQMVGVESAVFLEKACETIMEETSEEQSQSHQIASQNENEEISYGTIEPVYLEGRGYSSEITWAETMGAGAGLQLEEYKSNPHEWTSERAPTFRMHEYELRAMPEPEEAAKGRSISNSTDLSNDHESSTERVVAHEEEPWLVNENKTEELKVGVIVEDGPSTTLEETFEWTERTPTFRLHESELGTMLEPEEDAEGGSKFNSTSFFNSHEDSEVRAVIHEEEPQLVNDSRVEKLQVREVTKDKVSLDLDKVENESMELEEKFEWTSERATTFHMQEYELGTMLEPNEDTDQISESSSRGSFNDHGISKEREMNHEETRLVIDSRTEELQVGEMAKDMESLHLEECENESMKLNETFQWNSGRSLTFRHLEYELETMPEPDEDVDGRSESSSKERVVLHNDEPWLENDYETEVLKTDLMAEDGPSMHLEKCRNDKMELEQTLEPRDDISRLSLDDTFEKEMMTFHLEMPQDQQENLTQTSKQDESEEDIPEYDSIISSEGHESPSKMAEEELLRDHLNHLQLEKEKSRLTFEPYHFYNTTEPSEIVGLRHALYETQTSPLRSARSTPIHTPIGSPLHYMMRSPIASPMNSHIVSPLRSPINTSGSLSDVLFFS